ncbi:MAG: hypothetical protein KDD99_24685, partial [Bacteroidetes bacterium]|nr:hypothetical protein [Bacteroidota bacterium]
TVSPEMVRQNIDKVGILPDDPENKLSFAEITGAKYVITGSYFLQEDSIIINTRLSSTETGDELKNFPQLKGHRDQKEQLIEDARQYLLGYWVLRKNLKLPNINPPKYDAYQHFLNCTPNSVSCYEEVLKIDPDFLYARINLMLASTGADNPAYFSNKAFIEERWDQCTKFEKAWFNIAVSAYENDYQVMLKAQEEVYHIHPNEYITLHQTAFVSLCPNNMPFKAIDLFERLFREKEMFEEQILEWSYYHYLEALNRVKAHKKATDFYLGLEEKTKREAGPLTRQYAVQAFINQNRIEEAQKLIEEMEGDHTDYIMAAFSYKYIFPDSAHNPFFKKLQTHIDLFEDIRRDYVSWYTTSQFFCWESKGMAYYIMGEWEKAEESLLSRTDLAQENFTDPYDSFPDQYYREKLWHTGLLGCIYAQTGQADQSEKQIKELERLGELYPETHALFHRGAIPYLKARIYAVSGEKDLAVEMLKTSIEEGRIFIHWNFTFDLDFVNLKDYPPFEELIKPRG